MVTDTQRTHPDEQRRLELDWLRIAAFGLLILYHVGMLYVSWDFHVKSLHRSTELEAVMLALNPWRLALLFLVSGAATRFMVGSTPPGTLAGRRSLRLLLPVAFGMLVVVPPQAYLEVVEKFAYAGGFADFYLRHYLVFDGSFCRGSSCLVLPTWNHLWFVLYLWVYTMLVAAIVAVAPNLAAHAQRTLEAVLSGMRLLLLPALALAAFRLTLFPAFPVTHALIDDWYSHAVYGAIFVFGFLFARSPALAAEMVRLRWTALTIGIAAYALILVCRALPPSEMARLAQRLIYGVDQWSWIVAILGFGTRWLATRDAPIRGYLTKAVFAYYIVHQTAIIVVAYELKPWALPAWLEASIVIAATVLACAVTYEIARRLPWIGIFLGVPPAAQRRRQSVGCNSGVLGSAV